MKSACVQGRMPRSGGTATLRTLAMVVLAISVSITHAQSVDAETVEAWLLAEWAKAAEAQLPSGIVFEYAVETSEIPPTSELNALRAAVRDRPDHPMREDLEIYERRLVNGPDRTVYKVWYISDDEWRLSQTLEYDAGGVAYWDTARSGSVVWGMTNRQLTLVDAEHEEKVNRRFAARGIEVMQSAWNSLVYGNFAFGWFRESTPVLKDIRGDIWIAQAVNSAGVIGEWRGRWDSAIGRGFVTSVEFIGKTNGEPLRAPDEWHFGEWSYNDIIESWIVDRVAKKRDHRPQRNRIFLGASTVSNEIVQQLTSVPDIAGEDMVRGAVTVSKVNDLRVKHDEIQWLDESREIVHAEPAGVDEPRATNVLRWIGWATLIAFAGALLWLRVGRQNPLQ